MISLLASKKGFTLIEILMVILLVGILSVVSVEVIDNSVDDAKFDETLEEMRQIQYAIVGNPKLRERGARTSFGYYGDVGAMPAAIAGLTAIPGGVSAYAITDARRVGVGWNGPYLTGGDSGTDYTTDAWGTAYVWTPGGTPPTLVSRGADGAAGGTGLDQDITISFPAAERNSTVTGFISDIGGPFTTAAEAEINVPDGTGGLTQLTDTNLGANNGRFSIANVPMGVRSITVAEPDIATSTQSVGPVVITVDRANYFVPAAQLDFNP